MIGTTATVVAAGILAWAAAQMGIKGLLALVGLVSAIALFGYVRDRSVFFTFAAVCSLAFVLHKSFSAQDLVQSGGALSIYITTFDAVILLLYGLWISEGTFVGDIRAGFQRRIMFVPLIGALFLLAHAVYQEIRAAGIALDTLSLGMSADLEAAVAAGSTMVRIGTAIFGPRD